MSAVEFVGELARRAGVSRSDAAALLKVLGEISGVHPETGKPMSLREFALPDADAHADTTATAEAGRTPAGRDGPSPIPGFAAMRYVPSDRDIEELVAAAEQHPLGIEFLLGGELGAVAITFGAHAFAVDAARQQLRAAGTLRGRRESRN
ncbi:MAG: hypothetical protein NTY41_08510 [Proteobacteria bacterium]|nr:hypothetical protein [Pseudomonadota bacterium]